MHKIYITCILVTLIHCMSLYFIYKQDLRGGVHLACDVGGNLETLEMLAIYGALLNEKDKVSNKRYQRYRLCINLFMYRMEIRLYIMPVEITTLQLH